MFLFFQYVCILNLIVSYEMIATANRWYVVGQTKSLYKNIPHRVIINEMPITIWKDDENNVHGIHDICPHRGASLSKGRIDTELNCVVCPYHSFTYNTTGRMVTMPGQDIPRTATSFNNQTDTPHYKFMCNNGWIFMKDTHVDDTSENSNTHEEEDMVNEFDWIEPEIHDKNFRHVTIEKDFNMDARTVTENSLDILHISEVHTFGNRQNPFPISERFERNIRNGKTKAIYEYMAGKDSIANRIFGIEKLVVENEYILPHYTIARVKFGKYVNTIVTSALPISNEKTRLFVRAYRNNWVFYNPILNRIFDRITKDMMEIVVNEDKKIVETIILEECRCNRFITKYDKLTNMYRTDYDQYTQQKKHDKNGSNMEYDF